MKCLSVTRQQGEPQKSTSTFVEPSSATNIFSAKQVASDITVSVSSIMAVSNKLEQDKMEGVDAKEWVCIGVASR